MDDPYVTTRGAEQQQLQKGGSADERAGRTFVAVTVKQVLDASIEGDGTTCRLSGRSPNCDVCLTGFVQFIDDSKSTHMMVTLSDGTGAIPATVWTFGEEAPEMECVRAVPRPRSFCFKPA